LGPRAFTLISKLLKEISQDNKNAGSLLNPDIEPLISKVTTSLTNENFEFAAYLACFHANASSGDKEPLNKVTQYAMAIGSPQKEFSKNFAFKYKLA